MHGKLNTNKANTIDSVLNIVVNSTGGTKEVEGKSYTDVLKWKA